MPTALPLTPWQAHVARWSGCVDCPLHLTRSKVVLARGKLPCDVLFVGEAPGRGEDTLGQPFVGPAGILLDKIVDEAIGNLSVCPHEDCTESPFVVTHRWGDKNDVTVCPECGRQQAVHPIRCAWTNLIACIPLDDDGGKTSEPPEESIEACSPRLSEFVIKVARPRLIVNVGRHATDWLTPGFRYSIPVGDSPQVSIDHPAYILRLNEAQKGLAIQRCIVQLRNAVRKYLGGK